MFRASVRLTRVGLQGNAYLSNLLEYLLVGLRQESDRTTHLALFTRLGEEKFAPAGKTEMTRIFNPSAYRL